MKRIHPLCPYTKEEFLDVVNSGSEKKFSNLDFVSVNSFYKNYTASYTLYWTGYIHYCVVGRLWYYSGSVGTNIWTKYFLNGGLERKFSVVQTDNECILDGVIFDSIGASDSRMSSYLNVLTFKIS